MAEALTNETLFTNVLYKLLPGSTIQQVFNAFVRHEFISEDLKITIDANPLFAERMKRFVISKLKSSKWGADEPEAQQNTDDGSPVKPKLPSTSKVLHLMGATQTRDILCSLRMQRQLGMELEIKPKDLLKVAVSTDQHFDQYRKGYAIHAYFGAYILDWITQHPTLEDDYQKKNLNEATLFARLAYELGAPIVGFGFQKYTYPAALMLLAGKVLSSQHGKWVEFYTKAKAAKHVDLQLALFLEREQFEWTHCEYAALLLNFFDLLKAAELSILHYCEPILAKSVNPDTYKLAVILHAAHILVDAKLAVESMSPRVLSQLLDLGLQKGEIARAIKKAKEET